MLSLAIIYSIGKGVTTPEVDYFFTGLEECEHDYDANLLLAKARVTPLAGYTIPMSELSGTVLQTRLGLTAVKALKSEQSMAPRGAIMLSDSKCSISAVDTTTRVLKPFFHNKSG